MRAARKLLHEDFKKRWLDELPSSQRMELDVATLLDPRFKDYKFPGLRTTDLDDEKECALASLKAVWAADWKPAAPPAAAATAAAAPSPSFTTAALTKEAKKGASSSFFDIPLMPVLYSALQSHSTLSHVSNLPAVNARL